MNQKLVEKLAISTDSKIVYLVIDGLGGLPDPETGLTELETAKTPNLDRLAKEGVLGLTIPIAPGITPGSGPAHLSLFGYDPVGTQVGRGILDILGVGFELLRGDVAARINFCTVDAEGLIEGRRLCQYLNDNISIPGVELFIIHTKEYRGGIILRGDGLDGDILDTDPQSVGKAPLPAKARSQGAEKTAGLFNDIVTQAKELLSGEEKMILVRGIDTYRPLPQMQEIFKLNPAESRLRRRLSDVPRPGKTGGNAAGRYSLDRVDSRRVRCAGRGVGGT